MFSEFFRFDLRYQLKTPLLWIAALIFGVTAYFAISSDHVTIGGAIGNVHRNAPIVLVNMFGYFTIIGLFIVTVFIANAVLRDFELGTSELFFASPMKKAHYLFGRFAAGVVASLAIYVVIAIAMMLGAHLSGLEPTRIGAFSLTPYVFGLVVIVIPNLIFIGALLMMLAALTRSMLMVYLGVIGFFVLWQMGIYLTRDIDNDLTAALMDPFGLRAMARMTRYWSAAERNSQLPDLSGLLLANRVLWIALSMALMAATHALFRPQRSGTGKRWFGKAKVAAIETSDATSSAQLAPRPGFRQRFDAGAAAQQFLAQWRFDTKGVLKGVAFGVMLALGIFNLTGSIVLSDVLFGTKLLPVTHLMVEAITNSYSFLLVFILGFYAGELIWKERNAGLGEVTDAMPVPNWVPLAAKLATVALVTVTFMAAGIATCVIFQALKGYTDFELGLYFQGALLELIPYVLMGVLAVVIQVLTNNKFLGYLFLIVALVAKTFLGGLHFDHNLYNYASAPGVPYSDMNGYGQFLTGYFWFQGYWTIFAGLLVLLAAVLWVRGTAPTWRGRLAEARRRTRGPVAYAFALLLVAFVASGSWIFYNTNVLNRYVASDTALDRQAAFEKNYRKYKDAPKPRITAIQADVDIYPAERRVVARGHYHLVNKRDQAITEFHLQMEPDVTLEKLDFAPADLTVDDKVLGYRVYKLKEPMAPGAEMDLTFTVRVESPGFTNSGAPNQYNYNGTFVNNADLFPQFGYDERHQIVDRNERRKRGLGEVPRMAKLEDEAARADNYITDNGDWLAFETTVSTSPDQIALAPGYLQREWTENGRRYFHYKMDVPMLPFFAYLSARWAVKRDQWHDVPIEVYYDPKHPYNVDRMIEATKKSLDYFTANFSPYQHHQVRILEFPNYQRFAQSFANTIPFSESIGFIADLRDPEAIDYPFYVTAHEVAHQWWGHQVIGGNLQGSTMLSESLAQYSALMVQEHEYGRDKMRKFLKYELDRYLSDRSAELVEELPLFRVENQPYIHYRKGSLTLYRLREEIGEEALNRALAKFLKDKAFQPPPYPTSRDLLAYIRAESPADKQDLITDLFENITFYDNRVVDASASKRADGKYDVSLTLHAEKKYADGKGVEREGKLDDEIEIGVFARGASGKDSDEKPLLLERHRLTEREPKLDLVVDSEPYEVGIDPYNKLIDRVSNDNRKRVTMK